MHSKKNNTGRAASMSEGLALGAGVSLCITIAGTAILSLMLEAERFQWENIGYAILVMLLISSFAGTTTAIARIKRRQAFVCISSCALYFTILMIITALFFGGQYQAVSVTGGVILAGGISALLLKGNRNPKNKYHRVQKHR